MISKDMYMMYVAVVMLLMVISVVINEIEIDKFDSTWMFL
jgi:hypothetical protein